MSTGNDHPKSSERNAEEWLSCIAETLGLKLTLTTTSPPQIDCGSCVTGVAYAAQALVSGATTSLGPVIGRMGET